jgi:hypothetical protein
LGELLIINGFVSGHDHDIDEVQILVFTLSGFHRTAGNEDGGNIEPHSGYEHPGGDFIAVRHAHQGVGAMGVHHIFDAVGDDFSGGQGVKHTAMTHRDAVVHSNRVELGGEAAGFLNPLLDTLSHIVKVDVSGNKLSK